jgi:hypothetical protein
LHKIVSLTKLKSHSILYSLSPAAYARLRKGRSVIRRHSRWELVETMTKAVVRVLLPSATGLSLLLSACGGGGDTADQPAPIAATPAPPPIPVPTPTPTPTPSPPPGASQPTLLTLTMNTNLEGFFGSNGFFRTQSGQVSDVQDLGIAAGVPVRYEAQGGNFSITSVQYLIPNQPSSGPVFVTRDNAASNSSYAEYSAQSGGVRYRYTQLFPGSQNALLPLLYSSIGLARASYLDPQTGTTSYGITPMSFGILFNWDTAVLNGSATYLGVVLGHARGVGSRVYDVSGTVEIFLNYNTTAFTGRLVLMGKDDVTGEIVSLGSFELKEDRPRNVLDYFYASSSGNGRLQARLAGSLGEELMGGFDATIPDPKNPVVTMKLSAALAARK